MKKITIPGGKQDNVVRRMIKVFGQADGAELPGAFYAATEGDVDAACQAAAAAFPAYQATTATERAAFLEAIAQEILDIGDVLIHRAMAETGLPEARIRGERGRTVNQLRLFAEVVREGSWVEARITPADPDRSPVPRPDLRRMQVPLGPVAVFGAGNFPLAFSTAGGDTASALAAGCPVVLKAHEGHLGTHDLVYQAIRRAIQSCGLPEGVCQSLIGDGYATGRELVRHPLVKAAAFTGSPAGGQALAQLAGSRPVPIPFFAEMGSVNPVLVLPGALANRTKSLAQQLVASVTQNAGQFCTNPGLIILLEGPGLDVFIESMQEALQEKPGETMYGPGIQQNYLQRSQELISQSGVELIGEGPEGAPQSAPARLARVRGEDFLAQPQLQHEVFGPASLLVVCSDLAGMQEVLHHLAGQLTVTLQADPADLSLARQLLPAVQAIGGRVLWNGVPTGVEVSAAMHHGGPWPATTDSRFTSVGTAAILRWVRPVCYQNLPDQLLPPELQEANPSGIWRWVEGTWTQDPA